MYNTSNMSINLFSKQVQANIRQKHGQDALTSILESETIKSLNETIKSLNKRLKKIEILRDAYIRKRYGNDFFDMSVSKKTNLGIRGASSASLISE